MSDIGYPLVKCYHPRHVQNKYTGEVIQVGCGVCKACLKRRADKMSFLCAIEEQSHKYCMFATLTYSNDYVPRMYPEVDNELRLVRWYSYCDRLNEKGKLMTVDYDYWHKCPSLETYVSMLTAKCKLDGYLSYTSKRDAQLFLKRVRKNLSKYSDEKIRYYIVSEYGPKTFRAHYHVLFFYDEVKTQKVMSKVIRQAWQFGRVDCSISRGKCNSYVARYVNSNYCLPRFLGDMSTKPFSCHSIRFALGIHQSQKEEIYKGSVDDFIYQSGELNGNYVEFMPWRNLSCTFFPKCKGYSRKSDTELWQSYNILLEVKKAIGYSFNTIIDYARCILDLVVTAKFSCDSRGLPCSSPSLNKVISYFSQGIDTNPYYSDYLADYHTNSIARELYISRHFLTFVCDNDSYHERYRKFTLIRQFWQRYDYAQLVGMYISQIENRHLISNYDWYYINKTPLDSCGNVDVSQLSKELFYKRFVIKSDENFEKSIKHKIQNDFNGFFIN